MPAMNVRIMRVLLRQVKPDTKAWTTILEENGLSASDCIYFDDQEKNLKAAEGIGIQSFIFDGERKLIDKVRSLI